MTWIQGHIGGLQAEERDVKTETPRKRCVKGTEFANLPLEDAKMKGPPKNGSVLTAASKMIYLLSFSNCLIRIDAVREKKHCRSQCASGMTTERLNRCRSQLQIDCSLTHSQLSIFGEPVVFPSAAQHCKSQSSIKPPNRGKREVNRPGDWTYLPENVTLSFNPNTSTGHARKCRRRSEPKTKRATSTIITNSPATGISVTVAITGENLEEKREECKLRGECGAK